ncbi:hypothetical protein Cocul_01956 [Corynebacterium oculi]|uniref:Uncharacterized protein n=1 Tax=Corynebacterium oculi TaxID=1544416 RepID=A0A0Q0UC05_9CORY|nr:hypothetical protein Cocul_01956 [Corynebacterium oculi]
MEYSPVKTATHTVRVGYCIDDQSDVHVVCEGITCTFPRVSVNNCGQIHVLATLTGQVCNVAYIDAVRLVSCEFTAY